jgi:zona occludens toxin
MAVYIYTGVPRSGKSYKAVALIYNTFVNINPSKLDKLLIKSKIKKEKVVSYQNCYTNINQFNFDISDKIFKFDYDSIFEKISELFAYYNDKKDDAFLIEKAKELKVFNSLFVIDEAHNYLKSKENPVIVWWFTYHGHLYQDIILITQDLKLINDEYKRVAEYFYKAVPQRLRLSKNTFKYRQYSSYNMYQKDYISTISVKADKKIFDLYVSGAKVTTMPIFYKYVFFIFVLMLISSYFITSFYKDINSKIEPEQIPEIQNNQNNQTTQTINNTKNETSTPGQIQNLETPLIPVPEDTTNLKLFKFNCFDTLCYFQFEDKSTFEIPQNILKVYLMDIDFDKKFIELKNNRLSIYVLAPETKFNFIKQGVKNENKNETGTFNNSINAK